MTKKESIIVSIIIPVYQVSRFIERCLKSVMNQTFNRFECILVDDASPDDSIIKCERLISAYDGPIQFRILHHEHNRGLSAARNTGTGAAKGDFILYVDSDDIISNDCVEKLLFPLMKDDSIEMVLGESALFFENGLLKNQMYSWRHREDLNSQEKVRAFYYDRDRHFPPAAWNKMIRRKFLIDNRLRFKEGQLMEDTLWSFFSMKYYSHVFCIPDITYFYYVRPDSLSRGTNQEVLQCHWIAVYDIISRNLTLGDEEREAAFYSWMFCRNYIRETKSQEQSLIIRRFNKVLSFRNNPKEKTLLWAAKILPHNNTGQEIFKSLSKALLGKQSR